MGETSIGIKLFYSTLNENAKKKFKYQKSNEIRPHQTIKIDLSNYSMIFEEYIHLRSPRE